MKEYILVLVGILLPFALGRAFPEWQNLIYMIVLFIALLAWQHESYKNQP